jgi:beta-barrel assembly-enhancing protease
MRLHWLMALAILACVPAHAQIGNFLRGLDVNKALDVTKKVAEANKEYTQEEEIQLGAGLAAGMLGAAPLHKNEQLQRYVNRVGRWVAAHSERADLPWSFGVIENETINAFAMPGGTVIISYGLLKRLQNEAELAGVLGHEIAHVVQKHQLKAIQAGAWGDVLQTAGQAVVDSRISGSAGGALGQQLKSVAASQGMELLKNGFLLKPLDRGLEYEADRMGVVIAARAGYDPYGFVGVLQMLAQVKETDEGGIMATHPSAAERIAELEKFVPALEKYAGQTIEARFKQQVK